MTPRTQPRALPRPKTVAMLAAQKGYKLVLRKITPVKEAAK